MKRLVGLAVCGGAIGLLGGSAMAYAYDVSENHTIGTSYTRQSWEDSCGNPQGCTLYYSFRLVDNCSKTMYERVRYQRDLLPDATQASTGPVSTCAIWAYGAIGSAWAHGHHQDAKVTSGTATEFFRTHGP